MKQSQFHYWISAARPKTLAASAMPVLIGCALAYHSGLFQWIPSAVCFLFALILQIVSNFLNDYFDYKHGADRSDRLGPDRAVSKGWIKPKDMLSASILLTIFACLLGCVLIYYTGWQILWVGIGVCVGAFAYSAGPYPLAANGLGDVCVVLFYGVIPVGFTCYVQTAEWTSALTLCGLAIGLVSTNILVANNYRDREQDKISGKNTTIVLWGATFGQWFYLFNGIAAVILCSFLYQSGLKPAAGLPVLYLIPHYLSWKEMCRINQGRELNKILEQSAQNTIIFGILLIIGIIFA